MERLTLVTFCSTHEEICLHVSSQDAEWVVDTAASYHVTLYRNFFKTYKAGHFGTVKIENTSFTKVLGISDIQINTNVRFTITLKDVRHVLDLWLNLFSGIAFDQQGYENHFSNDTWKMTKGAIVAWGHLCGTLYKTHVKICADNFNVTEGEASQNLWHQRLDYMSEKSLFSLTKKNFITIPKDAVLDPCHRCLVGRQHRVSFSTSSSKRS